MIAVAAYPAAVPPVHRAAVVEDLPSGLRPIALPPLVEAQAGEPVLILRYVAPEIARARGMFDYDALAADFPVLCARDAQPHGPEKVVIALMDRAVPRGRANPEATQYVESFRRTASGCDWEGF